MLDSVMTSHLIFTIYATTLIKNPL